ILRGLLEETGLDVSEAYNGREGLQMAEREHPSAVLLDPMMPDLSRLQALETRSHHPLTSDTGGVVITSKRLEGGEQPRSGSREARLPTKAQYSRGDAGQLAHRALAAAMGQGPRRGHHG